MALDFRASLCKLTHAKNLALQLYFYTALLPITLLNVETTLNITFLNR